MIDQKEKIKRESLEKGNNILLKMSLIYALLAAAIVAGILFVE